MHRPHHAEQRSPSQIVRLAASVSESPDETGNVLPIRGGCSRDRQDESSIHVNLVNHHQKTCPHEKDQTWTDQTPIREMTRPNPC